MVILRRRYKHLKRGVLLYVSYIIIIYVSVLYYLRNKQITFVIVQLLVITIPFVFCKYNKAFKPQNECRSPIRTFSQVWRASSCVYRHKIIQQSAFTSILRV